ncbi:hypothetical protein A2U01_0087534, partial [Trifolium medium]|nr:hypothetical protein [Trifolium medium]
PANREQRKKAARRSLLQIPPQPNKTTKPEVAADPSPPPRKTTADPSPPPLPKREPPPQKTRI